MFAVLTLVAFLIAPGPSSASGLTVVEYYTEHGNAAIWQAVLAGFGIVFFVWFAGTFAQTMASAHAVLVSAGAMAAAYLVVLGAWESLGENYKEVDIVDVQSADYGDAHVLYDVGVGAAHMAGFADAAFVGATTAALLTSVTPWRRRRDRRRAHRRLSDQRTAADFRYVGLVRWRRRGRLCTPARLGICPERRPPHRATARSTRETRWPGPGTLRPCRQRDVKRGAERIGALVERERFAASLGLVGLALGLHERLDSLMKKSMAVAFPRR